MMKGAFVIVLMTAAAFSGGYWAHSAFGDQVDSETSPQFILSIDSLRKTYRVGEDVSVQLTITNRSTMTRTWSMHCWTSDDVRDYHIIVLRGDGAKVRYTDYQRAQIAAAANPHSQCENGITDDAPAKSTVSFTKHELNKYYDMTTPGDYLVMADGFIPAEIINGEPDTSKRYRSNVLEITVIK